MHDILIGHMKSVYQCGATYFNMLIVLSIIIHSHLLLCVDLIMLLFSIKNKDEDEDEHVSEGVVYVYLIDQSGEEIWNQSYDLCPGLVACPLKSFDVFYFRLHFPLSLDYVST